ncbi:MAG: DUF4349 domain-containing protein [Candidatus Brocadiae bacterium]|nr:DUF4349 domain-containing protein [Candidatus Brocadiia bacterium]
MNQWIVFGSCFFFILTAFSGCSSFRQDYAYHKSAMEESSKSFALKDNAPGVAPAIPKIIAPAEAPPSKPVEDTSKRMVHYNGYLKLSVFHGEETIEKASKICEETKGYVESRSDSSIVLRIPVARFHDVFAQIALLGDVLDRSITAHDVTDSFFSVDLHLKSMKATRERFLILLEKAKNEEEKLKILQEIRRLTESIDQLEQQLKTLASLAAYSRLSLVTQVKQARVGMTPESESISAFRWIYRLSPFRRDLALSGGFVKMIVPQGMVALEKQKHWIAESPDGTTFWASKKPNHPKGDTNFWMEAIKSRLAPEFRSCEVTEAGSFKILQFSDQDPAYKYWVGISVKDDTIKIIEVYFRSIDQENRYKASVLASIERGEQ